MQKRLFVGFALLSGCVGHPDPAPVESLETPHEATGLAEDDLEQRAMEFVSEWRRARLEADPRLSRLEIEEVFVETWMDPDSHLNDEYVTVEFEQRFQRGLYPEHGLVHLQLRFGEEPGLVQETVFDPSPGWDAEDAWFQMNREGADARTAAHEVWRELQVDGSNVGTTLTGLGNDPRVTRPLALAVLNGADVRCTRTNEWEDCGGTWVDFLDPEGDAEFDDPCLRRMLAIWALERGQLTPDDAQSLRSELEEFMALPAPERTLQPLAMQLAESLPSSDRYDMIVRFAATRAAGPDLTGDWERIVEDRWFDGLSDEELIDLYDRGLEPALLHLDIDRHASRWFDALDDEGLSPAIRSAALEGIIELDDPQASLALTRVAMDEDCGIAMRAAAALAQRGMDGWMPAKPISDDPGEYARALCMLSYADADESQAATWDALVAPLTGELPWTATYESEFEENGALAPAKLDRATLDELAFPFVETWFACEAQGEDVLRCEGDGAEVDFGRGPDGSFYVTRVAEFWAGCEC